MALNLGSISLQGSLVKLYTATLGSDSANISINPVPAGYSRMIIEIEGVYTGSGNALIWFNNDGSAAYNWQSLSVVNTTVSATATATTTSIRLAGAGGAYAFRGRIEITTTATITNTAATFAHQGIELKMSSGYYNTAAAINRIDISMSVNQFAAGTKLTLYGVV
jgi:hypothetical protein